MTVTKTEKLKLLSLPCFSLLLCSCTVFSSQLYLKVLYLGNFTIKIQEPFFVSQQISHSENQNQELEALSFFTHISPLHIKLDSDYWFGAETSS